MVHTRAQTRSERLAQPSHLHELMECPDRASELILKLDILSSYALTRSCKAGRLMGAKPLQKIHTLWKRTVAHAQGPILFLLCNLPVCTRDAVKLIHWSKPWLMCKMSECHHRLRKS